MAELQFEQVDDYFGVRSLADDGADVVVWLYPLVKGEPVFHHEGPFDGVRLDYNILRNPARHAEHYLRCVQAFGALGIGAWYQNRGFTLGSQPDVSAVRADIGEVIRHWASQGIIVGSDEALRITF